MDEEKKMYEKMKAERLNVHFPDEVDTPIDSNARTRFQRYRGMDSFATTVWDANEELPWDYGRIYRVSKQHYKRLKKLSCKNAEDDESGENLLAEPGTYVTVSIKDVPKSFYAGLSESAPLSLFGLFPNEQRMTLLSVLIQRQEGFTAPLKSKEP